MLLQVGLLHCPRSCKRLAALLYGEATLHEECPMNIESRKSEESRQTEDRGKPPSKGEKEPGHVGCTFAISEDREFKASLG